MADVGMTPEFRPLTTHDGYLPIEDHGIIGDCSTVALCGRDGTIDWLCIPRFDSPPLFASLLDRHTGGGFRIVPAKLKDARQYYDGDTLLLITELRTLTGVLRIRDALTLVAGANLTEDARTSRGQLVRELSVVHGHVTFMIDVGFRGGADVAVRSGGFQLTWSHQPDLPLWFGSTRRLHGLRDEIELRQGEPMHVSLRWGTTHHHHMTFSPEQVLRDTAEAWQRWAGLIRYDGPQRSLVRRSALTLKALDHFENGAIVAAATSSLPTTIGGRRNWDYRYAWVRDAAMATYAFRQIGLDVEAEAFVGWALDVAEQEERPRVVYMVDGRTPPLVSEAKDFEGYRGSRPVRWGNDAAEQHQHDVYGELLDCAYQWAREQHHPGRTLWERLRRLVEAARKEWRTPDHGIWEVPKEKDLFLYSIGLCQVALDRGAWLAERFELAGDIAGWRKEAARICDAILTDGWNPRLNSLTHRLGGDYLDASVLMLPLRRIIDPLHPRMVATVDAIRKHLDAGGGLLYRYEPDKPLDQLPGHEGAFVLCGFWVVDNLALQGRLDEAMDLYDSLCARANGLGLLSEQIDPSSGAFLGNFPQAFSHIGVIASGSLLAKRAAQKRKCLVKEA